MEFVYRLYSHYTQEHTFYILNDNKRINLVSFDSSYSYDFNLYKILNTSSGVSNNTIYTDYYDRHVHLTIRPSIFIITAPSKETAIEIINSNKQKLEDYLNSFPYLYVYKISKQIGEDNLDKKSLASYGIYYSTVYDELEKINNTILFIPYEVNKLIRMMLITKYHLTPYISNEIITGIMDKFND